MSESGSTDPGVGGLTGSPAFQFLRSVAPFDTLPDDELTAVADALGIEYHARGAALFTQGQSQVKDLYVVMKGALEVVDEAQVQAMAQGVEQIAALAEPVGKVLAQWARPNGLVIERVSVPLGVIGIAAAAAPTGRGASLSRPTWAARAAENAPPRAAS
jgi:hypothetical protein